MTMRSKLACPQIMRREIDPYKSPVSGKVINNIREKRDDLKRHGCIDAREVNPNRKKER